MNPTVSLAFLGDRALAALAKGLGPCEDRLGVALRGAVQAEAKARETDADMEHVLPILEAEDMAPAGRLVDVLTRAANRAPEGKDGGLRELCGLLALILAERLAAPAPVWH